MALRSGLSVYAYTITNGAVSSSQDISRDIEDLQFTTISPGGFGDLKTRLKVKSLASIPFHMRTFAYVAVMAGPDCIWQGRWDETGIMREAESNGEQFDLSAMGASSCLKDDPQSFAYGSPARTAQYIINDQVVTQRSAYIGIDTDQSQVLPDNPTTTFTRGYNGQDITQVLNDLLLGLGDYTWAVWNHSRNKDVAKFPTWQLYVHSRDTSTVSFQAYESDILQEDIRPSIEWSFNAITLNYKDATTLQPASVTKTDNRLNGNNTQGTAPFPFRRYTKDLSNLLLSSAQANTLAIALLNQYKNGGYKIEIHLTGIRNAQGVPIDLWRVRADTNAYFPTLSLSNILLPTGQSVNNNVFYITETRYQESGPTSTPVLVITCNTFTDTAAFQIARLQYQQESLSANAKSTGIIQQLGVQELGKCGGRFKAATGGDVYSFPVNFKATMSQAPSSITLTTTVAAVNVSSVTYADIQPSGFQLEVTATAAGDTKWYGTYITVGA